MRAVREALEQIAVRLSGPALEAIDRYAALEERTRSDMIRKLLSEAIQRREQEK